MSAGQGRPFTRRTLLGIGLGSAAAVLAGCASSDGGPAAAGAPTDSPTRTATLRPDATAAELPSGIALSPSTPSPSAPPTWTPGEPAVAINRGSGERPQVALTFHGTGSVGITRQVMTILADHDAHATVFAIGEWLAAKPQVAHIILDAGNELGNHTWSHPALSTFAPEPMYQQIVRCRDEIAKLTGGPGAFFRQSQGQYATEEECVQAGRAGYARILNYDIDSTDWQGTSPATIRRAVAKATAGSVVSLHLGRQNTIAALPGVLDDLRARGLSGVTGTELLR